MLTVGYNPNAPSWLDNIVQQSNQLRAQQERGRKAAMEAELQHARREAELQHKEQVDMMLMQQDQSNKDRAFTESKRRYDVENSPAPALTGTTPAVNRVSIPASDGADSGEGVDLWNAGNPASPAEGLLSLNATGYHPYDVRNEKEQKMEGGKVDAKGKTIYTLEMFKRGDAPYVTAAVPQGSDLFGKTLHSPDMPGVPIVVSDHFGTLNGEKIQGPRIDIATENRDSASRLTGPMRFGLAEALPQMSALKPIARIEDSAAPTSEQPAAPKNYAADLLEVMRQGARTSYQAAQELGASRKSALQAAKEGAGRAQTAFEIQQRQSNRAIAGDDLTAGMEPVPEHNTYRSKDGTEYFVSRSSDGKTKLSPYRPRDVVAKLFTQGSDGEVYPFGSNGQPLKPIPDGVTVEMNPGKLQLQKDNVGNTYQVHRDGTKSLLIPAKTKLTGKPLEDYVEDVKSVEKARADLDAKQAAVEQNGEGWFGSSKRDVEKARQTLEAATAKRDNWYKSFPDLADPLATTAAPPEASPAQGTPRPQTKAEFDALPSGSSYIGRDGRTYRKP